jgi:hypothetical protein
MKLQGQAIVIDALDIRNRKLHNDRRDRACLKLKVAASSLHSHLLAFAPAMSWWRAMYVVGKVVPSSIRLSAPVSRLRALALLSDARIGGVVVVILIQTLLSKDVT